MKARGKTQRQGGGKIMKAVIATLVGFGLLISANVGVAASLNHHEIALSVAVASTQPSARVLERLGDEFFSQKDTRAVTDSPVAVRSAFTKGIDDRVFMVSRWYDLTPDEIYTFSCEWIDPEGESHTTSSASFVTPSELDPGIFFTYTASLDVQSSLKEGQWTVRILINGDLVDSQDLTINSE
jgi:hypothetical protein